MTIGRVEMVDKGEDKSFEDNILAGVDNGPGWVREPLIKRGHYVSDIIYRFGCSMASRLGRIPCREWDDSPSVNHRGYFLDSPLCSSLTGKLIERFCWISG